LAIVRLMEDIHRTIFGSVDPVESLPFATLPEPSA
jgi:hypothetical protein